MVESYHRMNSANSYVSPHVGIAARWSSHYSNEVFEFVSASRYRNKTYEGRKAFANNLTLELNQIIDDYGRDTVLLSTISMSAWMSCNHIRFFTSTQASLYLAWSVDYCCRFMCVGYSHMEKSLRSRQSTFPTKAFMSDMF